MFVTDIRKEFYDVVVNQVRNNCFCLGLVAGVIEDPNTVDVYCYK